MHVPLPPWLDRALHQALHIERSHALLIAGPAGLGQFELVQALMAAWLCEDHAPGTPACGQCQACHLVGLRSHPDAQWLVPAAIRVQQGWQAAEEGAGKAKPSKEIRIDEVRAVLTFAQSTPARGVAKVIGIHPAEAMNSISANALLKTLEEPGGVLRFAIATEAVNELLPTIRSRCQILPVTPPPADEALAWLASQGAADADVLLALAGGQVMRARDWSVAGLRAAQVQQLPRALAQGDLTALADAPPGAVIDLLQRLLHDLLCAVHAAAPRYFVGVALPKVRWAQPLQAWGKELAQARGQADHPLQAALWIEALALQGQQALRLACSATPPLHSVA